MMLRVVLIHWFILKNFNKAVHGHVKRASGSLKNTTLPEPSMNEIVNADIIPILNKLSF